MKQKDYLQQSTGPGQPTQHPQTTESDFSGVTTTAGHSLRTAVAQQQQSEKGEKL